MFQVMRYKIAVVFIAGIVIGFTLPASVKFLRDYRKVSYSVARDIEKKYGAESVLDLSTEKLFIHEIDGTFLQILPVKFPRMSVFFDLQGGGLYNINLIDSRLNSFSISDMNLDGNWDSWTVSIGDNLFSYAGNSGYPDVVISETGTTARIDGAYYSVHAEDGRFFIIQSDAKLEIFPQKGGFFSLQNETIEGEDAGSSE